MRRPVSSPLIAIALFLAGLSGCEDSGGGVVIVGPPPDRVLVTPALPSVTQGDTLRLAVQVLDEDGEDVLGATITWVSGDPSIATVNTSGLVSGEAPGATLITATARSGGIAVEGHAAVTVEPAAPSS